MTVRGVDVSHYQATTPSLTGLGFLIAKAGQGDNPPDPMYARHIDAARHAGLVTGAYWFGEGGDVVTQAQRFASIAGTVDLYALDLERSADPMTNDEARAFIRAFHATGRRIGLYHSTSGYPTDALGADWRWVADYRQLAKPPIPYDLWQYRGSPLDLDRFDGTDAAFATFAGKAAPPAIRWRIAIAPHATVRVAVWAGSRIARWVDHPWGPDPSTARCGAPRHAMTLDGRIATVARVADGTFRGHDVHIGTGVRAVHS